MRPVGIGETLRGSLAKLVMRAAGEQANTACENLQLYAGLETGIEGGHPHSRTAEDGESEGKERKGRKRQPLSLRRKRRGMEGWPGFLITLI